MNVDGELLLQALNFAPIYLNLQISQFSIFPNFRDFFNFLLFLYIIFYFKILKVN